MSNESSFPTKFKKWKLFAFVLIGVTAIIFTLAFFFQTPEKSESPWKNLEDEITSENTLCVNLRKELSDDKIPMCSNTPGFQPLGSYYPVGGFVFKCGCQHASSTSFKSFLVDFYKLSRAKFPQIPFTLVVHRNCVSSCYDDFLSGVGLEAKFNTVFVDGDQRTAYFAQDAYVTGVLDAKGSTAVLSRKENYDEGCRDLKHISYEEVTQQTKSASDTSGHYSTIDDRGGNVLALPGRLLAVGETLSPELASYLEKEGNILLRMEVSKLPARHVDELFSIVRTSRNTEAAPCDFVLIAASPKLGVELMGHSLINSKLHSLTMGQDQMVQRNLITLQNAFKKTLGCKKNIPVIPFPITWEPYDFNGQTLYRNIWPNPVNAQVIDQYMIIPDPKKAQLRRSITNSLENYGIRSDFMDSDGLEQLYGGIHCASKFLHVCRPHNP